jgi:hypothetical protein
MSAHVRQKALTPRSLRVRNVWLQHLATRFRMDAPNASELETFSDDLSLLDAFAKLARRRSLGVGGRGPRVVPLPGEARWRFRLLAAASAVFVLLSAFPSRANELAIAATVQPAAPASWHPVTDSVVAAVHEKLLRMAQSELRFPLALNGAELAALVLGPVVGEDLPMLDGVVARAESLLVIRGRARDGARVLLRGSLIVPRAGLGQYRVVSASIDGEPMSRSDLRELLGDRPAVTVGQARLRFEIPVFIREIRIDNGRAWVIPDLDDHFRAEGN